MSDWISVTSAHAIAPGQWEVVELEDTSVVIYNIDGEFHAVENACSHEDAELAGLPPEGDQVICPRHGARFCLRTGEALTPPAYEPVHVFPVRVVDGVVQIRDDRWD